MQNQNIFQQYHNPPFFLHKILNYQKAVYERKGHWTEKEKVKYGVFLQVFRDKFQDRENPILNKMFRVMSDFIKTRNHNQCRSHHQKMERERFQIESILESIRSKYHPRQYELFFDKYNRHIQTLNVEVVLQQKGFTPHKNLQKRRKKNLKNAKLDLKKSQIKEENTEKQEKQQIQKIRKVQSSEQQKNSVPKQFNLSDCLNKQSRQSLEKLDPVQKQGRKIITEVKLKAIAMQQDKSQILPKKLNQEAKQKPLQKTGLEYDSDYENQDNPTKIAHVQIPKDLSPMGLQMSLTLGMKEKNLFDYNIVPIPLNSAPSRIYDYMAGFQGTFQLQNFPLNKTSHSLQQSYTLQIKQLDEQRQWHLNEANKLYIQMNQHIQRANTCEHTKQMIIKQISDMRRRFFYPDSFNSQY